MLVYSSFDSQLPEAFDGWCWAGSDLVVGPQGAARFHLERGRLLGPGLDGCYVSATETEDGLLLGTDSRGLARLFVYKDSTCWAVSSSLSGLVHHLGAHGKHLSVNEATLAPYSQRGNLTSQMTSFETIFQGVELVPSYVRVLISRCGRIRFTENQVDVPTDDYESGLSEYISSWRSRLATLLADDSINLSTDISGGIDSRTVLAFFMSLRDVADPNERFRFASSPSRSKDFESASSIANHYNFELNRKQAKYPKQRETARLKSWTDNSLGVYLLVYLDGKDLDPQRIQAHGAGGGNFRPVFKGTDMGDRLSAYEGKIPARLYSGWRDSVLKTMDRLTTWNEYANPMVLHYREFRNRFHFGHKPHRNVVFTPLNSAMTDSLTDGPTGVPPQQFYFDIMESLVPGLKDFPYDNSTKMPKEHHVNNITRVQLLPPRPGKIFGESPVVSSPTVDNTEDAYSLWVAKAHEALSAESVTRFLDAPLYDRARSSLDRALGGERLASNSRDIMDLSFAMSVHFAFEGSL